MNITCTVCGYDRNPQGSEFCDACGAELQTSSTVPQPSSEPNLPSNIFTEPNIPQPNTPALTFTSAKLIAKQIGAPIPEFLLDQGNAVIGIFDPDTGPVDVDLELFLGNETVSRNHAEIYQENGAWKIKDLGSTNGVFIKPTGQTRFGARITTPQMINPGDEIAIAKVRFLFQNN